MTEHERAARQIVRSWVAWQPMARLPQADRGEVWANDLYEATVLRDPGSTVLCLSVRRHDYQAVHDWRHLQAVKNDIAGEDAEAVELYPATSRLVDMSNIYWLWVFPPGTKLLIGFDLAGAYERLAGQARAAADAAASFAHIAAGPYESAASDEGDEA